MAVDYGLEARKQRQNSNPFEMMFFWTREVPLVRFRGWKKNFRGAAPQGGVFLYSNRITSKVGVTDSPGQGDKKSLWEFCCTRFRSRDIQPQSWKLPEIGVLWPPPDPSFMRFGSQFYFYMILHEVLSRMYISLFRFRCNHKSYRFLKIWKSHFSKTQKNDENIKIILAKYLI